VRNVRDTDDDEDDKARDMREGGEEANAEDGSEVVDRKIEQVWSKSSSHDRLKSGN
jgi:hypothetical protein